jgi:hypothetical protein
VPTQTRHQKALTASVGAPATPEAHPGRAGARGEDAQPVGYGIAPARRQQPIGPRRQDREDEGRGTGVYNISFDEINPLPAIVSRLCITVPVTCLSSFLERQPWRGQPVGGGEPARTGFKFVCRRLADVALD